MKKKRKNTHTTAEYTTRRKQANRVLFKSFLLYFGVGKQKHCELKKEFHAKKIVLEHAIKTNVSSNAFNVDTFLKIFKFHAGIESAIQCLMFSQKKKKKKNDFYFYFKN